MMASTARMIRLRVLSGAGDVGRRPAGPGTASLTPGRGLDLGLRRQGLGREVQVEPATHADLVVELEHLAAARALAAQLLPLEAVQHGRQQPEPGEQAGDQEPEEEGGALYPPDDATGDGEDEADEEVRH